MADDRKTIGNMNGPWALLLRAALASYPILIGWCVWITVQTFESKAFREAGDRFTTTDAAIMRREIDAQFSNLPHPEWKARIVMLEEGQSRISMSLVRIETILERISKEGKP